MPASTRIVAILVLGLTLLAPVPGYPVRGAAARGPSSPGPTPISTSCSAPLTLALQPGEHWPGSRPGEIPSDLPPGPIALALPLYPGATPTEETEELPSFSVPGVDYRKSASVMYRAPAGTDTVQRWYQDTFKACGYTLSHSQQSGQNGVQLSQGIAETRMQAGDRMQATRRLPLPFSGATRLDWSVWRGETIGLTRVTRGGTQAWAVSLPPLPPDPDQQLGG